MPLHLAHTKSYHPYNRENIERVRRDEEAARQDQQARDDGVRTADADARVEELRRRRRQNESHHGASDERAVASSSTNHGANQEAEGSRSSQAGPERQRRARAAAAEQDDQMGVYLDTLHKEGPAWYGDPDLKGPEDRRKTEEQRIEDAYKDGALKSSHDPLKAMSSFLAQREATLRRQRDEARKESKDAAEAVPQYSSVNWYRHYAQGDGRGEAEQDFHQRPGIPDPGGDTGVDAAAAEAEVRNTVLAGTTMTDAATSTEGEENTETDTPPTLQVKTEAAEVDLGAMGTVASAPSHGHRGIGNAKEETPGETEAPIQRSRSRSFGFGDSMYPTLLGEMIDTVLKTEAYLFDEAEQLLLTRYSTLPYQARYLFSRLIQRKDSWLRLQALRDSYSDEVPDMDSTVATLTDSTLQPFLITHADAGDDGQEAMLGLLTLEELKVLAKRMHSAKAGTTKASIIASLRTTKSQGTLSSFFTAPQSPSKRKSTGNGSSPAKSRQLSLNFTTQGKKASQSERLASEVTKLLGALIRVAPSTRSLIDRVALVFYRGAMLGGTALTTAVLARSRRRNYPTYATQRSPRVFPSRGHLLAFEKAVAVENEMEELLQWGDNTEATFNKALALFEAVWPVWQATVADFDGGQMAKRSSYHRMRFHAGWPQTRVVYKGCTILARFKLHSREEEVLRALLAQRYFRRGKRGEWYDRLALITAIYSYPDNKAKGKTEALKIAIAGIEDPDTHLIYHDQLQRRIVRLENQLPIPKSQKHDFTYAKLKDCDDRTFYGPRLDTMDDGTNGQSLLAPLTPSTRASPQTTPTGAGTAESPQGSNFQYRAPLRKVVKVERQVSPVKGQRRSNSSPVRPGMLQRNSSSSSNLLLPPTPTGNESDIKADGTRSPTVDVEGLDEALLAQYEVARKEKRTSMHSVWRGLDGHPCRVEEYVLQQYATEGYTGIHDEGGLLKMLFALCTWDIIFASGSVPATGSIDGSADDGKSAFVDITDVFETPYQRAPLDMDQDSFAVSRGPLIRERLSLISSSKGAAAALVAEVDDRERPRKTWAIGCRWDSFTKKQLVEVATLIPGSSLATIFQMMCEEWGHCSGGMPDLIIWHSSSMSVPSGDQVAEGGDVKPDLEVMKKEEGDGSKQSAAAAAPFNGPLVKLCEVKGPGDRLSETQKVWIDVLCRAGIQVEVSLVRSADEAPDSTGGSVTASSAGQKRGRSQSQSPVKKSYVTVTKREA